MIEIVLIFIQALATWLGYLVGRRNEGEVRKHMGLLEEAAEITVLTLVSFKLVCLIAENGNLIFTIPIFIASAWMKQKFSIKGEEVGIPVLLISWSGRPSAITIHLFLNFLKGSLVHLRGDKIGRAISSFTILALFASMFSTFPVALSLLAVMLII